MPIAILPHPNINTNYGVAEALEAKRRTDMLNYDMGMQQAAAQAQNPNIAKTIQERAGDVTRGEYHYDDAGRIIGRRNPYEKQRVSQENYDLYAREKAYNTLARQKLIDPNSLSENEEKYLNDYQAFKNNFQQQKLNAMKGMYYGMNMIGAPGVGTAVAMGFNSLATHKNAPQFYQPPYYNIWHGYAPQEMEGIPALPYGVK